MNLYKSKTYIEDLNEALQSTKGIENLKGHTVAITGATGTIGSFIVDMLLEYNSQGAGITLYALGRSIERLKKRFDVVKTDMLHYVEHDVLKPIEFDFCAEYIIYAGGNAHPSAFNSDPVGTIIGNINGTYNFLEYAKAHNVKRFVYISSGEIYGQGDLALDSFDETYSGYLEQMSPRSCYPISKRTAETLCASYTKQYGVETVVVRPCHTYGPGMTESDSRANAQFFRNVINGENIVLKSAGTQMRSYCYVADCASIILSCMLTGVPGEAYNSANANAKATIAELAKTIALYAGKEVIFSAPDAIDMANRTPIAKQVLDTKKVEALGWKGRFTLEQGVEHTLRILRGE